MSEWPWDTLGDEQEPWGSALEESWALHEAWMLEHYGCRDPRCFWCRRRVWMALQGLVSGGIWTTEADAEGPVSHAPGGPGTVCDGSPDGEHDVLPPGGVDSPAGEA